MPYKPKMIEDLPEWIYELSVGDDCLKDVLIEAWVGWRNAIRAIRERGNQVPRTCSSEMEAAEGILKSIQDGRTPRYQLAKKAAQAVRKFDMVYQCVRFRESDDSPQFARERPIQPLAARTLAHGERLRVPARESSVLLRRVREH